MTNEWTKEIERLTYERDQWEAKWRALRDQYATTRMALDSTRDNDAVVSAAVAAERNRWATDAKTRVVFLHANGAMGLNDVLSALDAAIGGDL